MHSQQALQLQLQLCWSALDRSHLPMDQPPPNRNRDNPTPQPPLHQSDADEEDENVKQLDECSSLYLSMQDCIVNSNRNWKACQTEVQALRECIQKKKDNKGK